MNEPNALNSSSVEATPERVPPADLPDLLARLPDGALVYLCLRDLLENGPVGTRGEPVGPRPSRSDILHFLAKWGRSIGLTEEACLNWLTSYAVRSLKIISTSSAGAIRHNAKGIVRYIYRIGYPFNCGKEKNPIRCRCDPSCPIFHQPEIPLPKPVPAADPSGLAPRIGRVKDHYRERYEQSLALIREMHAAGQKATDIVERLNREALPTKTGRKWTEGILSGTLKKLRSS